MEAQKNSTDIAIDNCTNIIQDYRKKSSFILSLIFMVTFTFLFIVGYSIFRQYYFGANVVSYSYFDRENDFVSKIQKMENISKQDYDTLIKKAISYQKLLNAKYEGEIEFRKKYLPKKNQILAVIFFMEFSY